MTLQNINSINTFRSNLYTNVHTGQVLDHDVSTSSPIKHVPREIFPLIFSRSNAIDIVRLGLANHHFTFLLAYAPLWNSLLHKHFPDSCTTLQSDNESPSFYKRLTIAENNIKSEKCRLQILKGFQKPVTRTMAYRDKLILISAWNKTIEIWDLQKKVMLQTLNIHDTGAGSIVVCGGKLISGSLNGTIEIRDLQNINELQLLKGHDGIISMAVYGDKLISGSRDNTIKIWDLQNGQELKKLEGHQNRVSCIAVCNGKLISGSMDKTIKIWNLESGQELHTLNAHEYGVSKVMVCDDKIISLGLEDKTIKIWDSKTGQELRKLQGHKLRITDIVFYDGKLISGSADGTIMIWDLESGQILQKIGAGGPVSNIIVYDHKILFSVDAVIKIWNLKDKKALCTLKGHTHKIDSILFCDNILISSSWDRTVQIWDFNFDPLSLLKRKRDADT